MDQHREEYCWKSLMVRRSPSYRRRILWSPSYAESILNTFKFDRLAKALGRDDGMEEEE